MTTFDGHRVGLVDVAGRVVVPLTAQLLGPDEVRAIDVFVGDPDPGLREEAEVARLSIFVRLAAGDEEFLHGLWSEAWAPQTWLEVAERFASDLQDWISESRFGWGQHRDYSLAVVE